MKLSSLNGVKTFNLWASLETIQFPLTSSESRFKKQIIPQGVILKPSSSTELNFHTRSNQHAFKIPSGEETLSSQSPAETIQFSPDTPNRTKILIIKVPSRLAYNPNSWSPLYYSFSPQRLSKISNLQQWSRIYFPRQQSKILLSPAIKDLFSSEK